MKNLIEKLENINFSQNENFNNKYGVDLAERASCLTQGPYGTRTEGLTGRSYH